AGRHWSSPAPWVRENPDATELVMRRGWREFGFVFLFLSLSIAQDQPISGVVSAPARDSRPIAQARTPSKRRPTIGVALEGGGALGLAHIGVLRWFEDHHVPIDYLAGTSMGGLV